MKGIGFVLKSLGVNLSDEDIRQVEILVPQVPAKLQSAVILVNQTIANLDERQRAVETRLTALENRVIEAIESISKYAETGSLINVQTLLDEFKKIEVQLDGLRNTNTDSNHDHGIANGAVAGAGSVVSAGTRHGRTARNR